MELMKLSHRRFNAFLDLRHVNQFSPGRIDGTIVREMLSHVRCQEHEIGPCLITRGVYPFCDVFLGFSLEVVAQFVIHFLVRLRPANCAHPMLPSYIPILLYSYLRATMVSTRVARRLGM